jgi:hypothetical protein
VRDAGAERGLGVGIGKQVQMICFAQSTNGRIALE